MHAHSLLPTFAHLQNICVRSRTQHLPVYVCVCVCVCERETERESVCVCVRERQKERDRVCVCVRDRDRQTTHSSSDFQYKFAMMQDV